MILVLGIILLLNNIFPRLRLWYIIGNLWPLLLILLGIYIIAGNRRFRGYGRVTEEFTDNRLIGDMRLDFDGKGIGDVSVSHIIGDLSIDLTGAQLKPGVNHLDASIVIGDATILVPARFPLKISARILIGDIRFGGRREGGIMPRIEHTDDNYETSESRLLVTIGGVIGDLTLQRVTI
jgi:lia operon protein LiaF